VTGSALEQIHPVDKYQSVPKTNIIFNKINLIQMYTGIWGGKKQQQKKIYGSFTDTTAVAEQ
jgi:hypothetical protein